MIFNGALPDNRIAEDAIDEEGAERAIEDTATLDLTIPPLTLPEVVVVKGGIVDDDNEWDKG